MAPEGQEAIHQEVTRREECSPFFVDLIRAVVLRHRGVAQGRRDMALEEIIIAHLHDATGLDPAIA